MSEQLFRKKSLERISSPEQLDDYLKVSTPSLWLILFAVVSLLVGIFVWASVETLETKIDAVGSVKDKTMEIVLTGADGEKIASGMDVIIGTNNTTIEAISHDDLGRYIAICQSDLPDGNYRLQIVIERVHPISFLFK